MASFLLISAQLLNFAVLLSYPINFFIYCRMSRAFRDAFTKLLCPSWNRSQEEQVLSTPTQYMTKHYHNNNHNNNDNHSHFELNDTNIERKNPDIEILTPSTVILNQTTAEVPMSLTPMEAPRHPNNIGKKHSVGSTGKQRVLFHDDVNNSTNTKFTDL
jgi:hypothetical protein